MIRVGILVFDDVEELDFAGPLGVFGMAARLGADCTTLLVAAHDGEIRGSYGLRFRPGTRSSPVPRWICCWCRAATARAPTRAKIR